MYDPGFPEMNCDGLWNFVGEVAAPYRVIGYAMTFRARPAFPSNWNVTLDPRPPSPKRQTAAARSSTGCWWPVRTISDRQQNIATNRYTYKYTGIIGGLCAIAAPERALEQAGVSDRRQRGDGRRQRQMAQI